MAEQNNDLIAGRNAVSEALRSQRSINKILLQQYLFKQINIEMINKLFIYLIIIKFNPYTL